MLRFCAKNLINYQLKRKTKFLKHNKYKNPSVILIQTLNNHPNLIVTFESKKFHTTSQLEARIFKDAENSYAYNILQTIPMNNSEAFMVTSRNDVVELSDFENLLNQDWRSKKGGEIVEGFKSTLNFCIDNNINVSDKRFDRLVDGLMDHVEELTDSELAQLLNCLEKYPLCDSYTAHNFHDVWSALDDVCCWKMQNWSTETRFLIAEQWYRLNLGKLCDYLYHFIDKMQKRFKGLNKNEIIHLFFYIKVHKRHTVTFENQDLLNEHINSMSLDEITISVMAFIPTKTKFKLPSTCEAMIAKLKQNLQTANEISVCKIVEVLRYSSHVLLIDQLMDLLDHLIPEIDRLSNLCCIHIALLGTTLQFFHEKSIEKVTQKVLKHINDPQEIRLKDLERLLVALTMFNYNPKTDTDIYEAIFKQLHTEERRKEVVKYPRCLPSALNLLSMRNIYSYELMDQILNMDSVLDVYGKNPKTLHRDVLALDTCIDIECPDYKGKRLNQTFKRKAVKWTVEYTPTRDQHKKITSADRFFLDVSETVQKIVDGQLHIDHVLPNFVKSDIIVCKDKRGSFVQPNGFENYVLGDVMRPLNKDLQWFAIVPVNWNNTMRNNPTQPLGVIHMKCRQLRTIGYEPILVLWNVFLNLQGKDRIDYIQNKIR